MSTPSDASCDAGGLRRPVRALWRGHIEEIRWRDLRTATVVGTFAVGTWNLAGIDTVLCPLRRLTGVPCPFCGITTAATEVMTGDLFGALAANPLIIAVVVTVIVGWGAAVSVARGRQPVFFNVPRQPLFWAGIIAAAWIFELQRFDLIF